MLLYELRAKLGAKYDNRNNNNKVSMNGSLCHNLRPGHRLNLHKKLRRRPGDVSARFIINFCSLSYR